MKIEIKNAISADRGEILQFSSILPLENVHWNELKKILLAIIFYVTIFSVPIESSQGAMLNLKLRLCQVGNTSSHKNSSSKPSLSRLEQKQQNMSVASRSDVCKHFSKTGVYFVCEYSRLNMQKKENLQNAAYDLQNAKNGICSDWNFFSWCNV